MRIHGLSDVMQGEMLEFPPTRTAAQLRPGAEPRARLVGAVILGGYEHISEGDTVKCTGRILEVPVAPNSSAAWSTPWVSPSTAGPDQRQDDGRDRKVAPGVIARQRGQPRPPA